MRLDNQQVAIRFAATAPIIFSGGMYLTEFFSKLLPHNPLSILAGTIALVFITFSLVIGMAGIIVSSSYSTPGSSI